MTNYRLPFAAIKILSESDATDLVNREPKKWNVISLWAGAGRYHYNNSRPKHRAAKSLCQKEFHDIQKEEKDLILCNKWHIGTILDYVRRFYDKDEPFIVHCHAGISRSSAICYLILLDWLKDKSENPVEDALQLLVNIKPANLIIPNKYIIGLGMHYIVNDWGEDCGKELEWNRIFYNSRTTQRLYGH